MEDTSAAAASARRRLLFRATHRGTKEADLLLGGYVRARLDFLTQAEVTELERVVALPDPFLEAVLMGRAEIGKDDELKGVLAAMRRAVSEAG